MKKKKSKDIMDSILSGTDEGLSNQADELDCLIYKTGKDFEDEIPSSTDEQIWQVSKENVTVQVWESKAKIRLKVSTGKKGNISMKRIANIAVDAILEELKKED
ncbi:MAG: hypothetical protein GY729_00970 [Desulfobacteraceae bacterium]|nr:hypothetical protein [Desulfobacteraceae bacterium]